MKKFNELYNKIIKENVMKENDQINGVQTDKPWPRDEFAVVEVDRIKNKILKVYFPYLSLAEAYMYALGLATKKKNSLWNSNIKANIIRASAPEEGYIVKNTEFKIILINEKTPLEDFPHVGEKFYK